MKTTSFNIAEVQRVNIEQYISSTNAGGIQVKGEGLKVGVVSAHNLRASSESYFALSRAAVHRLISIMR